MTCPDLPPRDPALHGQWVAQIAATLCAEHMDAEPLIDRLVRDALAGWRLGEATLWQRVRLRIRAERIRQRAVLSRSPGVAIPGT